MVGDPPRFTRRCDCNPRIVACSHGWPIKRRIEMPSDWKNEGEMEAEKEHPLDELFAKCGVAIVPIDEYERLKKIEAIAKQMSKSEDSIISGWNILDSIFDE